jgi:hypothetical protein
MHLQQRVLYVSHNVYNYKILTCKASGSSSVIRNNGHLGRNMYEYNKYNKIRVK